MIDDKLNRGERLRLEALAQAIAYGAGAKLDSVDILKIAKEFESFIKSG